MASLILKFGDLYAKVSDFLGMGLTPTGSDLTKVQEIVYRGLRQFYYPVNDRTGEQHEWSFLKQLFIMPLKSGVFKYALPENFSDIVTPPYFNDEKGYNELTRIGPDQILKIRAMSVSSGFPVYYSLAPFLYDNSTGTLYEMWVDPNPDSDYLMKFWYRIDPTKPTNDSDYLPGGVKASEAILETCFAIAETQEDDGAGTYPMHTNLSKELTQKLIRSDVSIEDSDCLGNLSRPRPNNYRWFSASADDLSNIDYL